MARFNFSQDPGGVWFWAVTTCPFHFIVPTLIFCSGVVENGPHYLPVYCEENDG